MNENPRWYMANLPTQLPSEYVEFANSEGRMYRHGLYRFPGVSTQHPFDLITWNLPETWRFAWPNITDTYFFFGLSAFGDAYAFDLENIDAGIIGFEAYTMRSECDAADFQEFQRRHLRILDIIPLDCEVDGLLKTYGECGWEDGYAAVPPPLFTPNEVSCAYEPIDMRFLMIMNGDIFTQYQQLPEGAVLIGIEQEVDKLGRARVRLLTR